MQTVQPVKRKKRTRVRYSSRMKNLLCHIVFFALPLLWQAGCFRWIYPFRLKNSAPMVAEHLVSALPFLKPFLGGFAEKTAEPAGEMTFEAFYAVQQSRENQWMIFLLIMLGLAWLITLIVLLVWRCVNSRGVNAAKTTQRAIHHYRLSMLLIIALNGAIAFAVWLFGVQFISGRGIWDYLTYFGAYPLNCLAALSCFRLAAPPAISGKKAFFKRL